MAYSQMGTIPLGEGYERGARYVALWQLDLSSLKDLKNNSENPV